ncbi:GGDEF domain-containing protein [uncultured Desulfovibrio sp.]|uniref:GGDEF domain-containing protein n=1 Tax=uncultured Desulfovibrio sp. TaxID=167968 RepID=UPI00262FEC23|nr:GGDEF domain-containing protein [uncultured Desulfovibrio sp.]
MFDNAGVPPETRWRSLLLFFREMKDYHFLDEEQKIAILAQMEELLKNRHYSDEQLVSTIRKCSEIFSRPIVTQLDSMVHETSSIIDQFFSKLSSRYGDIAHLEKESLSIVAENGDGTVMLEKLQSAFHRVKVLFEEDICNLENLAFIDPLTQVANRLSLDLFIKNSTARWHEEGQPFALALFDIDHFKTFNDTYGHLIGDQVLKVVGSHLRRAREEFDTETDALAARFGGDEFALVASGANAHLLPEIISRFCRAIKNFNLLIRDTEGNVEKNNLHITVSAGIALLDAQAPRIQTAEQLFDRADKALYHAKHNARSRAVVLKANDQYLILDEENHKAV